jgi:hypothetical protein
MEGEKTTTLIKLKEFSSSEIIELKDIFDELVKHNSKISEIASQALSLLQNFKD